MMTGEVKNLPRDVGSDIRPKIQADGAALTAGAIFQSKRRLPPVCREATAVFFVVVEILWDYRETVKGIVPCGSDCVIWIGQWSGALL